MMLTRCKHRNLALIILIVILEIKIRINMGKCSNMTGIFNVNQYIFFTFAHFIINS